MNVLIHVHLIDTLLTRPPIVHSMRTKAWPHQIHEAQGSQLNILRLPTRIMPLGVRGVIITERRKKHCLGGKKCLSVGGGGMLQFGPAGFGTSRLEITNPTQPTMQERKHPRSNLYILNHNGRSYEKRKGT